MDSASFCSWLNSGLGQINQEKYWHDQGKSKKNTRVSTERKVVSSILVTRRKLPGHHQNDEQADNIATVHPNSLWVLQIIWYLISCCIPEVQELVNDDGAGESGSRFGDSDCDPGEYKVMMNSSKGHKSMKPNQSSGKVLLCVVGGILADW